MLVEARELLSAHSASLKIKGCSVFFEKHAFERMMRLCTVAKCALADVRLAWTLRVLGSKSWKASSAYRDP